MKRILLCLLGLLAGGRVAGQDISPSIVNASGGGRMIGSNYFDYSIGEMTLVATFSSDSVIVTQGLLQNNLANVGIAAITPAGQVQVFPNPASTLINVVYSGSGDRLVLRLTDMTGQLVAQQTVPVVQGGVRTQLNISALAAATYVLEVSQPGITAGRTTYTIEKLK